LNVKALSLSLKKNWDDEIKRKLAIGWELLMRMGEMLEGKLEGLMEN
jgi:hypothetical protein